MSGKPQNVVADPRLVDVDAVVAVEHIGLLRSTEGAGQSSAFGNLCSVLGMALLLCIAFGYPIAMRQAFARSVLYGSDSRILSKCREFSAISRKLL
jgi:hypothetical protein